MASLITAERDLADRKIADGGTRVKILQNALQERRRQEAKQERKDAEKAKEKAPEILPIIREQFDINIELGQQLEDLAKKEATLVQKMEDLQAQLKELKEEFDVAKERVESVLLTEAIGLALREQRRQLPSVDMYRLDSTARQLRMSEIQEAQIDLDRKRREFGNIDPLLKKLVIAASYLPQNEMDRLTSDLRALLNNRRKLMQKLKDGYTRAFKILRNIEFTEQQLVNVAEDFADFLDRHLLWMRSSKPLHLDDLPKAQVALGWFFHADFWQRFLQDLKISFRRNATIWILGLLLAGGLFVGGGWARRELSHIMDIVNRQEKDSFALTLGAFGLTLYLAVGWPYIVGFVAAMLKRLPVPHIFTAVLFQGG